MPHLHRTESRAFYTQSNLTINISIHRPHPISTISTMSDAGADPLELESLDTDALLAALANVEKVRAHGSEGTGEQVTVEWAAPCHLALSPHFLYALGSSDPGGRVHVHGRDVIRGPGTGHGEPRPQ